MVENADGVLSLDYPPRSRFPLFRNRSQVFFDVLAGAFLERLALDELVKAFTPADIPAAIFSGPPPAKTVSRYAAQKFFTLANICSIILGI